VAGKDTGQIGNFQGIHHGPSTHLPGTLLYQYRQGNQQLENRIMNNVKRKLSTVGATMGTMIFASSAQAVC